GPSAGKRLLVLTSAATQADTGLLSALQSSGQAVVIHNSSDFSNFATSDADPTMGVGENAWVAVRTADYINADGSVGFVPAVIAAGPHDRGDDPILRTALAIARGEIQPTPRSAPARAAIAVRPIENMYPEMTSPNREYRILGLFRAW